jgi:hypothetical protein
MKSLIAVALLIFMAPVVGSAQSAHNSAVQDRAQGYLFFSDVHAHYGIFHVGGGADFRVFKGLGINSEVGVMGRLADGEGLFSIGPSYPFMGARKSKLEPFVDGGYTRTFAGSPGSQNLFFGGGINYWFFKRVGLRVDFRDYVNHYGRIGLTASSPEIRIGIVLR